MTQAAGITPGTETGSARANMDLHPRFLSRNRLRVLHVYKTWTPESYGGVEQFISSLCTEGAARNIDNRVLYLTKNRHIVTTRTDGARGIGFPLDVSIASTGFSRALFRHFPKFAAWADILHFHFPWPFGDLVYLASRTRKPMIVSYHSDIIRQRVLKIGYAPLMRHFLKRADALVAATPNYAATSPVLQDFRGKTKIIPFGLRDQAGMPADPARLAHWRGVAGENFALFVGVLRYYKGLHTLVEAAAQIRRETGRRIVIGGGGPVEAELRRQAETLGADNVIFTGRLTPEDKDALLRLCGVFVFPSHLRSEAFGISLLEAAMHGKPMVSCEIGSGMSYINLHEETGLAVPPENPAMLAQAVSRILGTPGEAARFGRNARRRYESLFTAETMANSYRDLYKEVVGKAL